jgi:hypothetical protein
MNYVTYHGNTELRTTDHTKCNAVIIIKAHALRRPAAETLKLLRHYITAYLK